MVTKPSQKTALKRCSSRWSNWSRNAEDYYESQKSKLLKDFDNIVKRTNKVFASHYGKYQANIIVVEIRQEYEALIPHIPYIGGKQPAASYIKRQADVYCPDEY